LGALHWGACFKTISTSTQNRWLDHSVWIWGIMPALIAWLAIHIFIPLALLLLAATLIVQRAIDQRTYAYYFENTQMANAFLRMRTHLTVVATVCLIWAGLTSLIRNY
jgi:nitrate/nitrite-specific signal transduction histidine kinase